MNDTVSSSLVRKLPSRGLKSNFSYLLVSLLIVLAGIATGWYLSGGKSLRFLGSGGPAAPGAKVEEKEAGIADESTFKDTAEGSLEKGGINGEGTHTLARSNDKSKNVALTSTVIDLDSFVGKRIQVWGQTLATQKAPWLMDVGKLKVID